MTDSSASDLPRGKFLVNEQSIVGSLIGGLVGAVTGFVVYVAPFYFGQGSGLLLPAVGIHGITAIFLLPSLAFAFILSFRRLSYDDQKAYTVDNLD